MTDFDKQISTINEGHLSEGLLAACAPEFEKMREDVINRMKMDYRGKTYSFESLLAQVAQVCLLDDFQNRLQSKVNRGRKVLRERENAERES